MQEEGKGQDDQEVADDREVNDKTQLQVVF
jgi:hypothetical protein